MSTELVPEGYFTAVAIPFITEDNHTPRYAELCFTKNGDTRKFVATFEIIEGPYAGRRLFWDGYMTKAAGERTAESLRFMGLKGNDLLGAETQKLDQKVSIKVGHNEWEGKTFARVDFVNEFGKSNSIKLSAPMSMDEKRKFAAMMRDSMSRIAERDGERAEPRAAQRADGGAAHRDTSSSNAPHPVNDYGSDPFDNADDVPF